jgi:hypothetical protein
MKHIDVGGPLWLRLQTSRQMPHMQLLSLLSPLMSHLPIRMRMLMSLRRHTWTTWLH